MDKSVTGPVVVVAVVSSCCWTVRYEMLVGPLFPHSSYSPLPRTFQLILRF